MQFDNRHLNTIIAALRHYESDGYADPNQQPNWIHGIATDDGTTAPLTEGEIDQLIEDLNCGGLPLIGTVPATGPTLQESLAAIWDVLHAYQDESIPAEKYRTMADDVGPEDPMWHIYDDTATAYEAEWDDICHHMALIHEALNIPQEDV